MSEEAEEGFDMSLLDPGYQPEPEPEPEVAEEVEQEVEQEAEAPEQELPADPEPQSDQTPNRQDLFDKELQQIQQLRATLDREVTKLQQQGDQPTEKQVERVEKVQSRLDSMLAETDLDPYQAPRVIAEEMLADRGRAEQALQRYEGAIRAMQEQQVQQAAELARLRFGADFPELSGQYGQILQQAHDAVAAKLGEGVNSIDANTYNILTNAEFVDIATRAREAAQAPAPEPKPVKDTAKKPAATRVTKTNKGGQAPGPQDSEARGEAILQQLNQEFFGS